MKNKWMKKRIISHIYHKVRLNIMIRDNKRKNFGLFVVVVIVCFCFCCCLPYNIILFWAKSKTRARKKSEKERSVIKWIFQIKKINKFTLNTCCFAFLLQLLSLFVYWCFFFTKKNNDKIIIGKKSLFFCFNILFSINKASI